MISEFLGPFALGILVGALAVLVAVYFCVEVAIIPNEECPPAADFKPQGKRSLTVNREP